MNDPPISRDDLVRSLHHKMHECRRYREDRLKPHEEALRKAKTKTLESLTRHHFASDKDFEGRWMERFANTFRVPGIVGGNLRDRAATLYYQGIEACENAERELLQAKRATKYLEEEANIYERLAVLVRMHRFPLNLPPEE